MKAAAAAGMSSAAVLTLTPDDVKAAASDEVTIPFDVDGEVKKQVPTDLMDWYYRARDATYQIKQGHAHKNAVVTIATTGPKDGDNPHVLVRLDESRGDAEERRGELPEERNGVRVEVETHDETKFQEHCDPDFWAESKKDDFPGGMETVSSSSTNRGTNSSRIFDNNLNWIGWTTAAHLLDDCSSGAYIYHSDGTQSYNYGEISDVDTIRDVAFIKPRNNAGTSPWNLKPSDHTEGVEILSTLSEEGLTYLSNNGPGCGLYGIGSCFEDLKLENWNEYNNNSWYCNGYRDDQIELEEGLLDDTKAGDSGGLYYSEDPDNPGNWYALGSHNGLFQDDYIQEKALGAQGFTIYNVWGRRWKF